MTTTQSKNARALRPEGSSSNRIGRIVHGGLGLEAEIVAVDGDTAAVLQAVKDGLLKPVPKPKGDKLTRPNRLASMNSENRAD